jgi:uncharacterized protein (DUF1778 family)
MKKTEKITIRSTKWEKGMIEKAIKITGQSMTTFITNAYLEKADKIIGGQK